ncbi:rod shape-determining protein RodA [candidate division KSB1 bacterium]
MRIDSHYVRNFDLFLLVICILLCFAGIFIIYSATIEFPGLSGLHRVQIKWFLVGFAAMTVAVLVHYRTFEALAWVFYGVSMVFLFLVLTSDASGFKAQRWLEFGFISFQPSEVAKIATIFALARFLSQRKRDPTRLRVLARVFIIVLIPMLMVLQQPDLGTSLVFAALAFPMLYWAGVPLLALVYILSPVIGLIISIVTSFSLLPWTLFMIALFVILFLTHTRLATSGIVIAMNLFTGLVTPTIWNKLHPYQKQRILAFLNPEGDPLGSGYQIIQSKVAIGSGKLLGRGFLSGTQKKLSFLPEQHTDFIFSVIGEELGFIGSLVILLVFWLLVVKLLRIAANHRNNFASLVAVGMASVLIIHIFVNVGMTVGMLPITGLPLPFFTYGGSFLVTVMFMLGMVMNFQMRRHDY